MAALAQRFGRHSRRDPSRGQSLYVRTGVEASDEVQLDDGGDHAATTPGPKLAAQMLPVWRAK